MNIFFHQAFKGSSTDRGKQFLARHFAVENAQHASRYACLRLHLKIFGSDQYVEFCVTRDPVACESMGLCARKHTLIKFHGASTVVSHLVPSASLIRELQSSYSFLILLVLYDMKQ